MTLDDLERPLCTLFQNTCVSGAHHKSFNEDGATIFTSLEIGSTADDKINNDQ